MENDDYPFDGLDQVVDNLLHLSDDERTEISEVENIRHYFLKEIRKVYRQLKADVFQQKYLDNSDAVVAAYLRNVSYLIDDLHTFLLAVTGNNAISSLTSHILSDLEALREEISVRFASLMKVSNQPAEIDKTSLKVKCNLSVDQIGLLLKAADDVRLFSTRSFSQLLRHITPYLSTDRMEKFSWKSARSSTYKMEAHDIEVTLDVLQKLIAKIKSYY